jgi:hypothetical protein
MYFIGHQYWLQWIGILYLKHVPSGSYIGQVWFKWFLIWNAKFGSDGTKSTGHQKFWVLIFVIWQQGDQMSLWKMAQNEAQHIFRVKICK